MKKFLLQTKSTLGIGSPVSDPVNDGLSHYIASVDSTVKNFKRTFASVQSSVDAAVDVLENAAKIYNELSGEQNVSPEIISVGNKFAELVEHVRSDALECKRAIADANITELQNKISRCKTVNAQRNKIFKNYHVNKKLVDLKEQKYSSEDKNLSDSKKYTSQVACRDDLRAQLQTQNSELDNEVAALSDSTDRGYRELTRIYVDSYDIFLRSLSAQLSQLRSSVDRM